jgi:ketosteroid isomerase-like protein
MNDPHRLLLEYLFAFRDPEKAASLFADNGVFEMPYLVSLGMEPRYVGRDDIRSLIAAVLELYPDWKFEADDVRVLIDTPTQAFGEYIAHPTAAVTGRRVHHLLMGLIEVENGQITLLREALNTVASAQALLPGGAADLPAPGIEISSY